MPLYGEEAGARLTELLRQHVLIAVEADTIREMVQRAVQKGYNFPYPKDEDGAVAKAYGATRTPQVFILDRSRRLRYRAGCPMPGTP